MQWQVRHQGQWWTAKRRDLTSDKEIQMSMRRRLMSLTLMKKRLMKRLLKMRLANCPNKRNLCTTMIACLMRMKRLKRSRPSARQKESQRKYQSLCQNRRSFLFVSVTKRGSSVLKPVVVGVDLAGEHPPNPLYKCWIGKVLHKKKKNLVLIPPLSTTTCRNRVKMEWQKKNWTSEGELSETSKRKRRMIRSPGNRFLMIFVVCASKTSTSFA